MTIVDLLTAWGRWSRGGTLGLRYGKENVLYGLMMGRVRGLPVYCSAIPQGVDFGSRSPDDMFVGVERAIAKLSKRRREAIVLEFLRAPNATQEEKGYLMRPPCSRVSYTLHLNSALNQLAIDLNVDRE